jgi:tetratricopeptide (TPR) repeat protein
MSSKISDKDIELHDRLYAKAWALIEGEIYLQGRSPLDKPGWRARRKLNEAISLFEQTLKIKPENWNSMWALGKIYQRLSDGSSAFNWFAQAQKTVPDNADVLREATLCAMTLGNGGAAVALATSAVSLNPNDPGLISNLALALLLDGQVKEASEQIAIAVRANPDERIARSVQQLIEDVKLGKVPPPRTLG